ncbi:caspase, EACC1-associated type [Streptomyces lichenis]|uniref:AAA domain-containing protein n=1 Tax=Streptomyces lichenis TaxID=2306967 RepID=A0ABT0I3Y5_9ACTN|nr:AAA domain-containing protein [Streptomyces lichenis]MCK8676035.1 AAA domain-containing protein [Streptomyces lichenis]
MTDNDRWAMLVGVSTYDSDAVHDLPPVRADLHYMQAVLESTEIGMYNDCAMVAEPTRAEMLHAIEGFLEERQSHETALLYFSGHGAFCEADNQLYFLTRDTDPANLPGTAVPASFLERTLQSCRAASKVVLLDCCSSGSVVQGWTAKGGSDEERPVPSTLLRPTGVYFITASDALQTASAMAPAGSELGTSRFTGEIVEGLRTGRVKDGGWITPDDLFDYLTAQMVTLGVPEEQRPTKSTIRAVQSLPLARSVARRVPLPTMPAGPAHRAGTDTSPVVRKARELARLDARDGVDWQRLLHYYVHCLGASSAAGMKPDRAAGLNSAYFLLGSGPEAIQAGGGGSLPAPPMLPRPKRPSTPGAAPDGSDALQEYWYGYPAVTLPGAGGARGRVQMRIAPLLMQSMELEPDEHGRDRLRPVGTPALNPGVVTELLADDDAAALLARWQPTWQEGNGAQMVKSVRELLRELGLPELEPLDLSGLREQSAMGTLRAGAHNAAVLLAPSGRERMAVDGLVDNLLQMSARTGQIAGTSLAALLDEDGEDTQPRLGGHTLVTPGPCNESQEQVIASAMSRPLTVATGPPGTGKSEVVTAVVATAVAAGQSVLVASTNNKAVDVVAERCDAIAPGLLFRTGNKDVREVEAAKLEKLLSEPTVPPRRSSGTVAGQLRNARGRAEVERQEAAELVAEEQRLLELVRDREDRAESLGVAVAALAGVWVGEDGTVLDRWLVRARRAAAARWWLPRSRRRRSLEAFLDAADGSAVAWPNWAKERPVGAEPLAALADALAVEQSLRQHIAATAVRDESGLRERRLRTADALSALSTELSQALSAEALARGRGLLNQRLQTLRGKRGNQRSQRNLLPHVRGWAISTHAVRQLELVPNLFDLVVIDEASQCAIPSVLPLLFRAKRALIIGDPMQLGHIPGVSAEQERQARVRSGLSAAQLEDRRLSYHVYSAYHAGAQNGAEALLLDEHYRCHPEIAQVVNGYCYAGGLQILTDVRRQVPAADPLGAADPVPVLGWVDVPQGASYRRERDRSSYNPAEAESVREVVEGLLARLPAAATVGVVTPFKGQKETLERLLPSERVEVGTVHAFQGGQRDVMVLSPVATDNTPPPTAHWVASQVNLWNVAVTRAKSQLITVGSLGFWQGRTGLPSLLADRSTALRPHPYDQRAAGAGRPQPPTGSDPFREELADRLQFHLEERGITDLERSAMVGGRPVDVLYTVDGQNTAVLLDTGPPAELPPDRHLRLAHARGDLLHGLPSGGAGAKPGPVARTLRVPAWRVLAGGEALRECLE